MVLVAMVAMGAAACTNDQVESVGPTEEGVSFYAEFVNNDGTRAYIDDTDGDKTWNTIWEQGDILQVSADAVKFYIFEYDSEKGKFTCNTEGVTSLVGQTVDISAYLGGNLNSKAGKKAWNCQGTKVDNFATSDEPVQLTANTSFLRYTYDGDGDVTFSIKGTNDRKVFVYDDYVYHDEVTISGVKGENFVAFWIQDFSLEATLSYSIGGVECKTANLNLTPGKIYNLGTLDKPSAWNIRGGHNDWSTTANPMYLEGNYFVARNMTLTAEGFQFNQGEWDKQIGAYQEYEQEVAKAPVGEWYQSQYNHDSYKGNIMVEDVNKKYDIYLLNSETMAYFYIAESGALPTFNSYALAGTFNDWSDTPMVATSTYGLFVAEDIELVGYEDRIKVKSAYVDEENNGWNESYGGGITNLEPNKFMSLNGGGNDIVVTTDGTYDVYFDYFARKLYLVEADADYTTATEQTENGPGKPVVAGVTIKGDWDSWQDATALVVKGDYYVAENVTIAAGQGFKFITGEGVYMGGSASVGTWNAFGNNNIELAAGTYDLYVSPANAAWCAVAAGSAAPALNKKYLVLDAKDWNQGGARFQAWCWGGSSADAWVSFALIEGNYFTAEIKDYTGCKLYRRAPEHKDDQWDNNSWNNSGDLSITNSLCRFTGWSTFEFVDLM